MRRQLLWLVLGIAALGAGLVAAARGPSPLAGTVVAVAVTRDAGTGIYTYRYRITNPAASTAAIAGWGIELNRETGDASLREEGLVNSPRYLRAGSADTRSRVPMVPVGMSGPDGWLLGLAYRDGSPARGLADWGADDEPFLVRPGQTKDGFQLTSYGLPGIRAAEIEADIEPADLPEAAEAVEALRQGLDLRLTTIGPKAPPARVVPLEFLNSLITLLHESRARGWVRTDGVHRSLLAKLVAAKRALEAGRREPAAGELRAFVGEAAGAGCRELECPGSRPLTSEAYALLVFNGEHLLARLGEVKQGR